MLPPPYYAAKMYAAGLFEASRNFLPDRTELVLLQENITMHGPLNVKFTLTY